MKTWRECVLLFGPATAEDVKLCPSSFLHSCFQPELDYVGRKKSISTQSCLKWILNCPNMLQQHTCQPSGLINRESLGTYLRFIDCVFCILLTFKE